MPDTTALPSRPVRSLSPSRAADFLSCPLLYRFRVIDRLPEPVSPSALRGTLVHQVLEAVYDLPPERRTLEEAVMLIASQWERRLAEEPGIAEELAASGVDADAWLAGAGDLVEAYFDLEDPRRLEPAARELRVQTELGSGLVLRGSVDRVDQAPGGALRIVDYKTGRAPGAGHEARAMFQLRFYALVLWRMRGRVPDLLQLMYLSTGVILRYQPDAADLMATQRKVEALWRAIDTASRSGDFRPNPSGLCRRCPHQQLCPEFGGSPPPFPGPNADNACAP